MNRKKVLILGGSGLLGLNWAMKIRNEYQVTLGLNKTQISLNNTSTIFFDFNNAGEIECKINCLNPDIIINAIGATNVDFCENDYNFTNYLNVEIPYLIAKISHKYNYKYIHISTDHLFSGTESFYSESSIPSPLNVYAESKYLAERVVLNINSNTLIIRTNFFGWGNQNRISFSDWIIYSLRSNLEIMVFNDVYFTPILIERLVVIAHELVLYNISGIVNVVGCERVSKYEFACKLAETFNLSKQLLIPTSLKDSSLIANRPLDMSLSLQLLQSLVKKDLVSLCLDFKRLREQESNGYCLELSNSTISK